jgi:hypothetical protein
LGINQHQLPAVQTLDVTEAGIHPAATMVRHLRVECHTPMEAGENAPGQVPEGEPVLVLTCKMKRLTLHLFCEIIIYQYFK